MVEETFDTREQAHAAWMWAETQAAVEADGIDVSSLWVDYSTRSTPGSPLTTSCSDALDFDLRPNGGRWS